MNRKYEGLSSRRACAKDIFDLVSDKSQPGKELIISGPSGCGKKYTVSEFIHLAADDRQISILSYVGDQLVETGRRHVAIRSEFSINLSVYLGLSWSWSQDNESKINYIINNLRNIKKNCVILLIPDIENANSEIKDIAKLLSENREFIQKQTGKRVYTLITSVYKNHPLNKNSRVFELNDYTRHDLMLFVKEHLKYEPSNVSNEKYEKLREISNSDFNIVSLIYRDVLDKDIEYSRSLNELVQQRLKALGKRGQERSIDPNDFEEIVLTCSLSIDCFSRFQISKTARRDEEIVNNSIQISIEEKLFTQKSYDLFDFVSKDIKSSMENEMLRRHNTRLLDYYNYLTEWRTDEYYLRFYYLLKYTETVNDNIFCLLILAMSKPFMLNDGWSENKIIGMLTEYHADKLYMNSYTHFANAQNLHKQQKYVQSNKQLEKIDYYLLGPIAQAEISRLTFRNYYLGANTKSYAFKQTVLLLEKTIDSVLTLDSAEGIATPEEKIFKLQIIYDVAPYLLDGENNYERFQQLYDISRVILRQEHEKNNRSLTIQYITNTFNRKAFLFANPMQAMPYYEEAKTFFLKNNILDQYCITLVCQAGTSLACQEYRQAIALCKLAQKTSREKKIKIPKAAKLKNNLLIAEFLHFEDTRGSAKKEQIEKKAVDTANKLAGLAKGPASATKHVLLTNAASLYLYAGLTEEYLQAKSTIEASLGCKDVTDITDDSVNDFYRYHFAWFHMFFCILRQNWEESQHILQQLNHFIPALFKKQERVWNQKNEGARALIANRRMVSGYEFSKELVTTRQRETQLTAFYHRGLMLSDLQYTSIT